MAQEHGPTKTARTLRLDYSALKKRLQSAGPDAYRPNGTPTFVELVGPATGTAAECLIELEGRSGTKMRIQLKGAGMPDWQSLGRLFWSQKG